MNMHLIGELLIAGVVVGGIIYVFNLAPIDATIKRIITIIVLIIAAVWAIRLLMGMF